MCSHYRNLCGGSSKICNITIRWLSCTTLGYKERTQVNKAQKRRCIRNYCCAANNSQEVEKTRCPSTAGKKNEVMTSQETIMLKGMKWAQESKCHVFPSYMDICLCVSVPVYMDVFTYMSVFVGHKTRQGP